MVKIGIIGGSGLDDPNILQDAENVEIYTPFGKPSSPIKTGKIGGVDVAILARHGLKHEFPPSSVNYRANIWALKRIGCTHIIATTAVGSLREDIGRGDLVIIDQFIDFTRHRSITFHDSFEEGAVHTPMAEPFSEELRELLILTTRQLGLKTHSRGTVVTIEGPRFSTKAESRMFRAWGADIINMSIAPEAVLANEAGIPYAAVAMSTDYDCIFDNLPPVSWDEILKVFNENASKVTSLLTTAIPKFKKDASLSSFGGEAVCEEHKAEQPVHVEEIVIEEPEVEEVPERVYGDSLDNPDIMEMDEPMPEPVIPEENTVQEPMDPDEQPKPIAGDDFVMMEPDTVPTLEPSKWEEDDKA